MDSKFFDDISDHVVKQCHALQGTTWIDWERVVRSAVKHALENCKFYVEDEFLMARALAERDGRWNLFNQAEVSNAEVQTLELLRGNYLSDARHLIARVRELREKQERDS